MTISAILSIIGLSATIIGAIILAIDASKFFKMITATLHAHQIFIDSYISKEDVFVIQGMHKHLERRMSVSNF